MTVRVSIIIPAFNSVRFIGDAIDSVLAQDYAYKEVIVVDDGSTDDTADLVESYGDRVRLIRQENSGPGAARNRGVAEACGEYIAFLDSDDYWLSGKLAAQVAFLDQNPDIGLLYHDWLVVSAGTDEDKALRAAIHASQAKSEPVALDVCERGWMYNELLLDSIMTTISVMMRRSLFNKLGGFDDSLPQGQDYEMWLRVSRETPIAKLCAKLAVISERDGSISTTWRRTNYVALILEKALATWGRKGPDGRVTPKREIDRALHEYWQGFAYRHVNYGGDRDVALKGFLKALAFRPWRIKTWLYIAWTLAARVVVGKGGDKSDER